MGAFPLQLIKYGECQFEGTAHITNTLIISVMVTTNLSRTFLVQCCVVVITFSVCVFAF